MTQPTNPPAGWYPDPDNREGQRYWDGAAWTSQTAPLAGAQPEALISSAASATTTPPWWQTWWAIIPGLLLCAPIGLIGLWRRRDTGTKVKGLITAAVALMIAIAIVSPGQSPTPATTAPTAPTAATSSTSPTPKVHLDAVPRLVGSSRPAARAAITSAGLMVGQVSTRASKKAPGTVVSQVPAAGDRLRPRSTVDLVIAAPPPRVPRVLGMAKRRAINRLTSAGFTVAITRHDVSYGPNGVVLGQRPTSGTRKMPGSRVRIVLSVLHTPPPAPSPTPTPTPAAPARSCTTTSSGTCIRGGEFCPQADYGTTGYDASGRAYTCTGDTTHPHWE